jgi:hypothetical protein
MIIECSISPNKTGLKVKAKCKATGQATTICYNNRQSLIDNAKYALVNLCLILGISGKSFVWCIVGDVVLFVSVLSGNTNVFSI